MRMLLGLLLVAPALTGCTSPPGAAETKATWASAAPESEPRRADAPAAPDDVAPPVSADPSGTRDADEPTVTLHAENADLRKVLLDLARLGGGSVILTDDVQGTISLSLRDIPWTMALETVARTCGYRAVPAGPGALRVQRPDR